MAEHYFHSQEERDYFYRWNYMRRIADALEEILFRLNGHRPPYRSGKTKKTTKRKKR
jgi:hypothetical protein